MTAEGGEEAGNAGSGPARKPILFLDVDGPLNPFAARSARRLRGYRKYRMSPAVWAAQYPDAKPLVVFLNADHGPLLRRLPVELVWATTWEDEANEWIGPRIGLPELPFVAWPPEQERHSPQDGRYWKTRLVAEYAAGRPFAWFDDQIGPPDLRWCAERHPAPSLLQWIDPAHGLRARDLAVVERWAKLLGTDVNEDGDSAPISNRRR